MEISAFTFVHNAFAGGYPLREAILAVEPYVNEIVVVDCQSDDGTREWLDANTAIRVIGGQWGHEAGATLAAAHALNTECTGDIILHFEADEVFDNNLVRLVTAMISIGERDISVYRLQLEQNFQRCRWYPEPVHRVFPRGSVKKVGHTTDRYNEVTTVVPTENGYLWDCTNCFRDNWLKRVNQQAALWHNQLPVYRATPRQFTHSVLVDNIDTFLDQEHWTWTTTPFKIPDILQPLVGRVRYE